MARRGRLHRVVIPSDVEGGSFEAHPIRNKAGRCGPIQEELPVCFFLPLRDSV